MSGRINVIKHCGECVHSSFGYYKACHHPRADTPIKITLDGTPEECPLPRFPGRHECFTDNPYFQGETDGWNECLDWIEGKW